MKSAPEVYNELRTSHSVKALPRVSADWNLNRYNDVVVDNVVPEEGGGTDPEVFPIESIVEPVRPVKGVNKARINQGIVTDDYADNINPRFYIASVDDKYKYWQSPQPSDGTGAITNCEPYVLYGTKAENGTYTKTTVNANKIVVGLENSWASPVEFMVQTTTDGTTWSTVSTNPAIPNNGKIVLYYNGTAWSVNRPADLSATRSLCGVRLVVTRLGAGRRADGSVTLYNKPDGFVAGDLGTEVFSNLTEVATDGFNSHFSLIELGARLEVDLSDRVVTVNTTIDTGASDQVNPVGTITSNVADLTLWNGDGMFSSSNAASPYQKMLEANVEFNMEYVYEIDANKYSVKAFRMFSDIWSGQTESTVNVALEDAAKYLKEIKPRPALYENLTTRQAFYRICDSVGFSDYNIVNHPNVTDHVIPVFYVDGEMTVWEIFDELATSSQSVVYFNADGILNIRTREAAFDPARATDWVARGRKSGNELADIHSDGLSQTGSYEANVIKVGYANANWSDFNNGQPSLETVWEPEGTVTLRATPLSQEMAIDATEFNMSAKEAKIWPYEGLVNIGGEIIRFDAKYFVYYTYTVTETFANGNVTTTYSNEVAQTAPVTSLDEMKALNEQTPYIFRSKNGYNGTFRVSERGVWNSPINAHTVDADEFNIRRIAKGKRTASKLGFKHNMRSSTVTLSSAGKLKDGNDRLFATRGSSDDTGFNYYGFKFKFDKGGSLKNQTAGFLFNNSGTGENGYYVEFVPTKKLGGKERKDRNELMFYARDSGKNTFVGGRKNNGARLAIAEGVNYDVDIYFNKNDHKVSIWVNGKLQLRLNVPNGKQQAANGKFGMYIRGRTKTTWEYIYAATKIGDEPLDDTSFLDRERGAYVGEQWEREWVYEWKTRTRTKKKKGGDYRQNVRLFDEFGDFIHEIREYDVSFDPSPVWHSRLYMSSDWNTICTEYRSTPFGAKFILANVSRKNAVLNGEDSLSFEGTGKSVDNILMVYGRTLVIEDGEEVEVRNEKQIRARGEIETEVTNPWIQSKAAAQALADWINVHWGTGTDEIAVTLFGNPLIEPCDVVAIDHPEVFMSAATSRYFVTSVQHSFESGITTTLVLRRIT